MSAASDALATLDAFTSLRMEGAHLRAEIARVLRDATISRSIDGVSTLTLDVYDDARKLLRSGILSSRVTMQVDAYSFELVQVRKSGPSLSIVLEDLPVAALRRHDKPYKVGAGTMSHVDFSRRLVAEERWLKFSAPFAAREKAKTELARGNPTDPKADKVDTWTAIGKIADARGWRRFVQGTNTILYVPETYLASRPPKFTFSEDSPGIENIDGDYDIGKPVATAKVTVRAKRWAVPVGDCVQVTGLGPMNGKWIVSDISRSLFSVNMDVTISRARPTLPEPEQAVVDVATVTPAVAPARAVASGAASTPAVASGGQRVSSKAISKAGYMWPVSGTVTSEYGIRTGDSPSGRPTRLHAGIDIAVPVGTPVLSPKEGVVIFEGEARGYGYAIYIRHKDNIVTRYGHLSEIRVIRGQMLAQGVGIGLSGGARGAKGAGDSTGPHLHFEVRPNDVAANPRKYLP